jgi:hypothetical protein
MIQMALPLFQYFIYYKYAHERANHLKNKIHLNPDINTVGEKPMAVTDITPTNNATIGMRNEWS